MSDMRRTRWTLAACGALLLAGYAGGASWMTAVSGWGPFPVDGTEVSSEAPSDLSARDNRSLQTFLARMGRRYGDFRMSHPDAASFAPYDPILSDKTEVVDPPPSLLTRLEAESDPRGIGTAYVSSGNFELGLRYLQQTEKDAAGLADRAAAHFALGKRAEALELLDEALEKDPSHEIAAWNRAVVLESLDLNLAAAAAFELSASASSDPAWARAARERAERHREEVQAYRSAWHQANEAGKEMVARAIPMAPQDVEAAPGISQLYLYDALRSATDRDSVLRLLPVAAILDVLGDRQSRLMEQVYRTAERDFSVRAPIAARYRALATGQIQNPHENPAVDALIDEARDADQEDILIGAIYLGLRELRLTDEFVRRTRRTGDPWFEALADTVRARRASASQQTDQALLTLLEVISEAKHPYRTLWAQLQAVDAATVLHRITLARRIATEVRNEARRRGAWDKELRVLQHLGRLATRTGQLATGRAYFQETNLREPDFCGSKEFVRRNLTVAELQENDLDAARRTLLEDNGCPFEVWGAEDVLSVVDTHGPAIAEPMRTRLFEALEAGREQAASPGDAAFERAVRGRLLLTLGETDEGLRLLRSVLERGRSTPRWDGTGIHAHALATATLVTRSGAEADASEVVRTAADSVGSPAPQTCTLAGYVDAGRATVAWIDAEGSAFVEHDPKFSRSLRKMDGSELIPEEAIAALRPCEAVRVFAGPNLMGDSTLLPPEFAWSYVLAEPIEEPGRALTDRALVVANVALPAALGFSALPPYRSQTQPRPSRLLSGHEATLSRVLDEMRTATEIEFYTHGTYNLGESQASMLVMAPDTEGRFALTVEQVGRSSLEGAPLVLLTACSTTRAPRYRYQSWSLPHAFLDAGAWTVIAAGADVPSIEGQAFFDAVRRQIRSGTPPAVAVRNARMDEHESSDSAWREHVIVFGR